MDINHDKLLWSVLTITVFRVTITPFFEKAALNHFGFPHHPTIYHDFKNVHALKAADESFHPECVSFNFIIVLSGRSHHFYQVSDSLPSRIGRRRPFFPSDEQVSCVRGRSDLKHTSAFKNTCRAELVEKHKTMFSTREPINACVVWQARNRTTLVRFRCFPSFVYNEIFSKNTSLSFKTGNRAFQ